MFQVLFAYPGGQRRGCDCLKDQCTPPRCHLGTRLSELFSPFLPGLQRAKSALTSGCGSISPPVPSWWPAQQGSFAHGAQGLPATLTGRSTLSQGTRYLGTSQLPRGESGTQGFLGQTSGEFSQFLLPPPTFLGPPTHSRCSSCQAGLRHAHRVLI